MPASLFSHSCASVTCQLVCCVSLVVRVLRSTRKPFAAVRSYPQRLTLHFNRRSLSPRGLPVSVCIKYHSHIRYQIISPFGVDVTCKKASSLLDSHNTSNMPRDAPLFPRLAPSVSQSRLPVDEGGEDLGEFSLPVGRRCSSQQKQPETASKLTQRRLMSVRNALEP